MIKSDLKSYKVFNHNFGLKTAACFRERFKVGKFYDISLGSGRFLLALGIFETHQFANRQFYLQ